MRHYGLAADGDLADTRRVGIDDANSIPGQGGRPYRGGRASGHSR